MSHRIFHIIQIMKINCNILFQIFTLKYLYKCGHLESQSSLVNKWMVPNPTNTGNTISFFNCLFHSKNHTLCLKGDVLRIFSFSCYYVTLYWSTLCRQLLQKNGCKKQVHNFRGLRSWSTIPQIYPMQLRFAFSMRNHCHWRIVSRIGKLIYLNHVAMRAFWDWRTI